MLKKIMAVAGAGAMIMAVVAPVLADYRHHESRQPQTYVRNEADIKNVTVSLANTGLNFASNEADVEVEGKHEVSWWCNRCHEDSSRISISGDNYIETGVAISEASDEVKANVVRGRTPSHLSNDADVTNYTISVANTGLNFASNEADVEGEGHIHVDGVNTIITGDAQAVAWTVSNVNWVNAH